MLTKWMRLLIFLLFAGFLVIGAVLQLESIREKAKQWIIEKIESETGFQVKIESIRLFPSFQLTARNVAIAQESTLLIQFEHLYIGIYPHELFSKSVHISKLHIEAVNIFNLPSQAASAFQSQSQSKPPFNVIIDDLFIENIKWSIPEIEPPQSPVTFRGSLDLDPTRHTYYSNFKFSSPKNSDQWFQGDFAVENQKGTLIVQKDNDHKISLEAEWTEEGNFTIPRLLVDWRTLSLTGTLSFHPGGIIQNSTIYLSLSDLSEFSPLSGSLYGEVSIFGDLRHPVIEANLKSDQISGFDHTIHQAQMIASTLEKGIFDLKFTKNEHPYHFYGHLTSQRNQPMLSTQLDLAIPLEEIARLAGWDVADINGELAIRAAFGNTAFLMSLEMNNGLLETFDMGTRFQNINALIEGDTNELKLISLTANDTSSGSYSGTGYLKFDAANQFPFAIKMNLEKAEPLQSELVKTALSGTVSFSGNLSKASIEGELTALSPQLKIPEKLPETTDAVEITYINQSEQFPKPTETSQIRFDWPIDLNINFAIRDSLIISGKGLNSVWTGKLSIEGELLKPKTKGEIKLDSGYYLLRGKKFEFNQGSISFHGDPKLDTTLFLAASMDLTDLTILASLKGPIANPSITLSSSPPMSQRAILSWLLFGKGITDINPMEEKQLSRSLRSILDKVDSKPDILSSVGDILGLDQVEIGTSATGQADDLTVKVGKYLTERTYLSISRNISRGKDADKNASCFGIETRLGRYFRFRAEGDTETNGRLNLLWKKDY